jgi:hypothetical protein
VQRPDWDGTGEKGEPITGHGYGVRDRHDGFLYDGDVNFASYGARVLPVAGVSHRMKNLQRNEFSPGRVLQLIPEPRNKADRNAIGVWDDQGRTQIGYIPATETKSIHAAQKRTGGLVVLSLWEFCNPRGERGGLRILILQPDTQVDVDDLPLVVGGIVVKE